MTVYESRIRREYIRRRTMGEMVLFTLLLVATLVLLAVAAKDDEEPPPMVVDAAMRAEIVRSWYGELYPAYVVAPRR